MDHLELRVKENEIFGLLGPNGAGKTTTILMLLGLTEPAEGSATIFGYDPTHEPIKVKRITGYLPEKVGFYENLTAVENMRFIAELNEIPFKESEDRIKESLKIVDLEDVKDNIVGKYSHGMKQRLGVAEVLVKRPRLVFLDEPTSGLDPKGINELLDLIAGLPKIGTTVVLSSHQLHQVQKVCNTIGILSKGKMVVQGDLEKLGREKLAGGRYIIDVETTETAAPVVDLVKKIKGVSSAEATDHILRVTADADLRAEIAKVVVQNNIPLIQIKAQEFSLDDIYMKYFREGQPDK